MDKFSGAVVAELVNRSMSFLLARCEKETTATTVQEELQLLRRLLMRSDTIVEEAERRHVPSRAMLRQLKALRDETFRGYYVLDAVRGRAALGGGDRRRNGKDDDGGGGGDDEVGRRAFALSRFNPAKRVRFPSDEASSDTESVLGGASSRAELQQVVRSLGIMIADMEFVMLLASYQPLYRQPYSAHMFVEKCMFGRHMEKEIIMDFLLKNDPCGGSPKLGVLPIFGPAHIGKSTLVENVCDNERVRNHFSLILFCTGNDLKDMTASSFKDKCMTKHHTESDSDERLVLVVIKLIEDVDDETWNILYSSQRSIAQGSKMIITSRSENIVRFGTAQPLRLKCLPLEAYWYLFRTVAFGSDDPGQHPKMTSLALEMANVMQGSFMFAHIGAALLKDHFNAQSWFRVLTRIRQQFKKNADVIGEYPDDVKAKDHPLFSWSLVKPEPDKFMLHDIYPRGPARDEVPSVSFLDLVAGNDQPQQGKYEILFWKSRIPPYFNYVCTCEVPDT